MTTQSVNVPQCFQGKAGADVRWQPKAAKEITHPARLLDHLPQSIGLSIRHCPRIANLPDDLDHNIVRRVNLRGEERRAEEVLERVGHAMQELDDKERFDVGRSGAEEEQPVLGDGADECGRIDVGQVGHRRPGRGVGEVGGQQDVGRRGPAGIDMFEDGIAKRREGVSPGVDAIERTLELLRGDFTRVWGITTTDLCSSKMYSPSIATILELSRCVQ